MYTNDPRCGSDDACRGNITLRESGNALDCASGFGGVLCSNCIEGFHRKQSEAKILCERCDPNMNRTFQMGIFAAIAVGIVVLFVFLALCIRGRAASQDKDMENIDQLRDAQDEMKILLSMVQVLQLCSGTLRITIPSPWTDLTRWFGLIVLNLNIFELEIVPMACLFQFDFRHQFAATCAVPVVLLLAINLAGRGIARGSSTPEELQDAFRPLGCRELDKGVCSSDALAFFVENTSKLGTRT